MRPLASLALAALVAACSGAPVSQPRDRSDTEVNPSLGQLRAAPATATLDARVLGLQVFASRDFMPITPPGGRPLIVSARVVAADSGAVPAALVVERLWVVRGDSVWIGGTAEQRRDPDGSFLEVVAREGPRWAPGDRVEVIVEVRGAGGRRVMLRAADVTIGSSF